MKTALNIIVVLTIIIGVYIGSTILIKKLPPAEKKPMTTQTILPDSALIPLPSDAPEKEKKARRQLIRQASVAVNSILIGQNCHPDPIVAHLKKSKKFNLVNKDETQHTISFSTSSNYVVQPGKSLEINGNIFSNEGIYALRCDNRGEIRGYIFVTD